MKDWVVVALGLLKENNLHPWPELPPDWGFLMSPDVELAIMGSRGAAIHELPNQLLGYPVTLGFPGEEGFLTMYRKVG